MKTTLALLAILVAAQAQAAHDPAAVLDRCA